MQRQAFFGKLDEKWKNVKEAPFWMTASTVILALLSIGVGLFFSAVIKSWIQPASDVLARGIHLALGSWGI
jgi:NADH:ubiquinone oxidoreductase subunit 5 (subunit L)/multisubunit Na+/H+ antiporter MnhA subunit